MPSNHLISVVPFSSGPQSFPVSGSFPISQLLASGSHSIGASASPSELISFRIDWSDLLAVPGTLKSLLQHHNSSALILLYGPTLTSIQDYWKNHSFEYRPLSEK